MRCDRCGRVFGIGCRMILDDHLHVDRIYDLCPTCVEKLNRFLECCDKEKDDGDR